MDHERETTMLMLNGHYGEAPVIIDEFALPGWTEFMHYLYLPVRIPYRDGPSARGVWMPERLWFLEDAVRLAIRDAAEQASHLQDPYVYVTARRGFATPGNPLNRPGWHCDDFGGTDLNYIWTDAYPTRVLRSSFPLDIDEDDEQSMQDMQDQANDSRPGSSRWIEEVGLNALTRLTPYVIHDTPIIPEPGGMRSFFKISVSTHRYDLIGNSHNHLLDYDWPMVSRVEMRNRPDGGSADYSGGER